MLRSAALLLTLLLAAAAAHAETYKWVDERGVVNYSNAPPAGIKAAKPIPASEDRVSIIETDAATKAAAAQRGPSYYEQQLERDWQQRQRLMAAANAAARPAACSPGYDCAGDYAHTYGFLPGFAVARPRPFVFVPPPAPSSNPPSRARLLQVQR